MALKSADEVDEFLRSIVYLDFPGVAKHRHYVDRERMYGLHMPGYVEVAHEIELHVRDRRLHLGRKCPDVKERERTRGRWTQTIAIELCCPEYLVHCVQEVLVREVLAHELKESFYVGGVRWEDPHEGEK